MATHLTEEQRRRKEEDATNYLQTNGQVPEGYTAFVLFRKKSARRDIESGGQAERYKENRRATLLKTEVLVAYSSPITGPHPNERTKYIRSISDILNRPPEELKGKLKTLEEFISAMPILKRFLRPEVYTHVETWLSKLGVFKKTQHGQPVVLSK